MKELVAKADTDGDGTVNQQEYLNAVAADVMPTIIVDAVPDGVIDVEPEEPRAEEAGAGRGGASWRVVAAWARWERGGLLSHLEADDLNTLRDAFSRGRARRGAGPDVGGRRAGGAAGDRRGRPVCGGDATTCVAAFASAASSSDETTLTKEVSSLRRDAGRARRRGERPEAAK